MSANRKSAILKVFYSFLIAFAAFCLIQGILSVTYANAQTGSPEVTVTINNDGRIVCAGDLMGEGLWYPGKTASGVIRIYNKYKLVVLKDMNVNVSGISSPEMDNNLVYNAFLESLKLSVQRGKFLFFNETVFENMSLLQLENMNKSSLGFEIAKDDFIDLQYTLHMAEEATDELENLTASVGIGLTFEDNN